MKDIADLARLDGISGDKHLSLLLDKTLVIGLPRLYYPTSCIYFVGFGGVWSQTLAFKAEDRLDAFPAEFPEQLAELDSIDSGLTCSSLP